MRKKTEDQKARDHIAWAERGTSERTDSREGEANADPAPKEMIRCSQPH